MLAIIYIHVHVRKGCSLHTLHCLLTDTVFRHILYIKIVFILQGAVLGAFYWGYAVTQILGGYLGDRFGGDIVMSTAAVGWTILGFWTPLLPYFGSSPESILVIMVFSRVLMGILQGLYIY